MEFADRRLLTGLLKMDVLTSMSKHIRKFFKNEKLIQLMEFPVLFLGSTPENTPALYSLMNYADIQLGTWYPKGGMFKVVEGMVTLAESLGVKFHYDEAVTSVNIADKKHHPPGHLKGITCCRHSSRGCRLSSPGSAHSPGGVSQLLPQVLGHPHHGSFFPAVLYWGGSAAASQYEAPRVVF